MFFLLVVVGFFVAFFNANAPRNRKAQKKHKISLKKYGNFCCSACITKCLKIEAKKKIFSQENVYPSYRYHQSICGKRHCSGRGCSCKTRQNYVSIVFVKIVVLLQHKLSLVLPIFFRKALLNCFFFVFVPISDVVLLPVISGGRAQAMKKGKEYKKIYC